MVGLGRTEKHQNGTDTGRKRERARERTRAFPGRMEATSRSEVAVAQPLLGGLMHVIRLYLESW